MSKAHKELAVAIWEMFQIVVQILLLAIAIYCVFEGRYAQASVDVGLVILNRMSWNRSHAG